MKRYPHTLRRDGLSTSGWTLKGPVVVGRFTPPSRGRAGQYHSTLLRIRYENVHERRVLLRFQTPKLARGGHRLMGEARPDRGVEVRSTVAEEQPLWLAAKKGGFLRRQVHLVRSDGVVVAVMRQEGDRFEVDLNADACRWFAPPGDVVVERMRRVMESGLAMFLAALVEEVRRDLVPVPVEERPAGREMAAAVTRLLRRRTPEADADDEGGQRGPAT